MTGNKNYCIVCSNYAGKIVEGRKVTMHRIPSAKTLSRIWCSRLQLVRKDLKPGQLKGRGNTRVCSEHFLWKKGPQPGDDIPSVFANRTYKTTAHVPVKSSKKLSIDKTAVILDKNVEDTLGIIWIWKHGHFFDNAIKTRLGTSVMFHDYCGRINPHTIHQPKLQCGTQTCSIKECAAHVPIQSDQSSSIELKLQDDPSSLEIMRTIKREIENDQSESGMMSTTTTKKLETLLDQSDSGMMSTIKLETLDDQSDSGMMSTMKLETLDDQSDSGMMSTIKLETLDDQSDCGMMSTIKLETLDDQSDSGMMSTMKLETLDDQSDSGMMSTMKLETLDDQSDSGMMSTMKLETLDDQIDSGMMSTSTTTIQLETEDDQNDSGMMSIIKIKTDYGYDQSNLKMMPSIHMETRDDESSLRRIPTIIWKHMVIKAVLR